MSALGDTGGGSSTFTKLLPMLAPLVMSFIGRQMGGGGQAAAVDASAGSGGGGLADILGGMLGGKR